MTKAKLIFLMFFLFCLSIAGAVFGAAAEETDRGAEPNWEATDIGEIGKDETGLNKLVGRTVTEAYGIDLNQGFSFGFITHYTGYMSGTSVNQLRVEILDETGRNGLRIRSGYTEGAEIFHSVTVEYLFDGKYYPSPSNPSAAELAQDDEQGHFFNIKREASGFYLQIGTYNFSKDYQNPPAVFDDLMALDMSSVTVKLTSFTNNFSDRTGYCYITDVDLGDEVKTLGNNVRDWSPILNNDAQYILNRKNLLPEIYYENSRLTPNNYTFKGDRVSLKSYYIQTLAAGEHTFCVFANGQDTGIELIVNVITGTSLENEYWSGRTDGKADEEQNLKVEGFKSLETESRFTSDFDGGQRFDFIINSEAPSQDDILRICILQEEADTGICLSFDARTDYVDVEYILTDTVQSVSSNYMMVKDLHNSRHSVSVEKVRERGFEIIIDGIRSLPVELEEDISLQSARIEIQAGTEESADFEFLGMQESDKLLESDWITLNGSTERVNEDGSSTFTLNERRFEGSGDAYSRERLISAESYDVTKPIVITGSMDWSELDLDSWLITFRDTQYDDLRIDMPAVWQGVGENNFDFLICRPGWGVINLKAGSSSYLECLTYTDNSKMAPYASLDDLNVYRFDIGTESTTLTVNGTSVLEGINIKQSDFAGGRAYITIAFLSRLKGNRVGPEEFTVRPVNSINVALNQEKSYEKQSKINFSFPMTNVTEDTRLMLDGKEVDSKYYEVDVERNKIDFIGEYIDELVGPIEEEKCYFYAVPGGDTARAATLCLNLQPADVGYTGDLTYGDGEIGLLRGPMSTVLIVVLSVCAGVIVAGGAVFAAIQIKRRRKKKDE